MSVKRGPGYIVGGSDGWLRVRRHISATIISLPEFLHIDITDVQDGRIHFIVKEGVAAGSICSVVEGNHVRSGAPPHGGPVRLTFSISKQQLTHPGGIARRPPPGIRFRSEGIRSRFSIFRMARARDTPQ